jgi:hypothetical protein
VVAGDTPILVHNNDGDLYHGTNTAGAANIRASGVDVNYSSRTEMDFGRGFYTTSDPDQAAGWAARIARRNGGDPVVLKFSIPQSQLDALNSVTFTGDSPLLRDAFTYYRGGGLENPYQMMSGPMLRNIGAFAKGAPPVLSGDQTVFFGDTGPMLDAALQGD